MTGEMGGMFDNPTSVSPLTLDRPQVTSPPPQTDGMDPASPGGPAPMNSALGPYATPVASDPLLEAPIRPGNPVPHVPGSDVDALILN